MREVTGGVNCPLDIQVSFVVFLNFITPDIAIPLLGDYAPDESFLGFVVVAEFAGRVAFGAVLKDRFTNSFLGRGVVGTLGKKLVRGPVDADIVSFELDGAILHFGIAVQMYLLADDIHNRGIL